ncbi:NFX1-type zinc finger-containing protein 1, partial [Rhizopus stolonifer]
SFHKKLGYILHNKLPELTPRTFGFLLESLVIAMESKPIHDKQTVDIAHKIWEAWSPFKIHFMRFINTYAYTPSDLRLMLRFSTILVQSTLRFEQELPIMDYMGIYKRIGNIVALESKTEMFECLRILKALPLKEVTKGSLCTDDLMFTLPLIPNAKSIMFETMGKINYLKEYEKLYQTVITNQTNDSWIEDILNYLITQFLLLREEMVGPAKKAIQDLLEESSTSEMKYPVYPNTTPKAFTILLHSSGPGVVFELGNMQDTDDIMADFEEGVLVLLLPEKSESESTASKSVKDTALMGQAIRASARSNGPILRLVSIQINKNDLRKLNWDIKYTMIVFRINAASTLSTLEWLYKTCFNMEKKHFSKVLTPRILAASNNLTTAQIKAWDESVLENALTINADATPYYIVDAEIDVSCIMANSHGNYRACPGKDIWPRDPLNMQNIPTTKLPPFYCLSPSQLESVKFAMSHRIAIISGAPGTGKTFMAAKLAQLLGEALTVGQFHQPVLVIAKSQSTLDDILSKAAATIPGIVRFGNEPFADNLMNKQITRLATISASDQNYRQHQQLERQLLRNQAKLNILLGLRAQAKDHDPSFLATTIPPQYRQMLEKDYIRTHGVESHISDVGIWTSWAHHDKRTKMFDSVTKVGYTQFKCAQWYLENEYIKRAGRGLLPIMDGHTIKNRFINVANLSVHVTSIANASCWPFDQSASYSGAIVRDALMKEWRKTPVDRINYLSDKEKTDLIHRLVNVLVNRIDKEIQGVMQDQIQTAEAHDDNLIQKWIYMCRFKRVIGMTAANASAHRNFISSLWPRAVIVDEASEILESTLSSVILGPRTEHVVLLGISDHLTKPCVANPELVGEPHRLDTSLFERWKSTNIEKAHLEEQWRMHSEIASVIHQFDNRNNNTAPLASCDENMVDGKYPAREALYGISERALYIHYQPSAKDDVINPYYKRLLMSDVTNAQVNEARYVASLATYLSQQPYQKASIAILTLNVLQKYLIRMILKDEIPKRTCFTSNLKNIALDTVEQYAGRQNSFTIISTATPGYSCSTLDNVTQALTRAKYGLFIIGKPEQDRVHPHWKEFANYMQDRGLYGNSIRLTCHAHGDTINAGCWQDFVQMKNGGCQRPCNTLMSDSHTCKEECHFLSHAEVVCREPCNRIRPSGCTHACLKKCYECSKDRVCPPCTEKTEIVLPCGHQMQGLCHMLQGGNGQNIQCKEIVNIDLTCGHSKTIHCYRARDKKVANLKCDLKQSVTLDCGHTVTSQCGIEPICIEPCSQSLECGHKCQGICGIPHLHDRSQCIA